MKAFYTLNFKTGTENDFIRVSQTVLRINVSQFLAMLGSKFEYFFSLVASSQRYKICYEHSNIVQIIVFSEPSYSLQSPLRDLKMKNDLSFIFRCYDSKMNAQN